MDKVTQTADIIDYARPMMMAQKHIRLAHDALLSGDNDVAMGELLQVVVEARMAINAIKLMEENKR
jgi:hypothetical protein